MKYLDGRQEAGPGLGSNYAQAGVVLGILSCSNSFLL